jgi:hypothetical protein
MSAREELFRRVAGAFVDESKANGLLDAYRAEVLREAADNVRELYQQTANVQQTAGVLAAEARVRRMAVEAGDR